jgi:hypothetical protein
LVFQIGVDDVEGGSREDREAGGSDPLASRPECQEPAALVLDPRSLRAARLSNYSRLIRVDLGQWQSFFCGANIF